MCCLLGALSSCRIGKPSIISSLSQVERILWWSWFRFRWRRRFIDFNNPLNGLLDVFHNRLYHKNWFIFLFFSQRVGYIGFHSIQSQKLPCCHTERVGAHWHQEWVNFDWITGLRFSFSLFFNKDISLHDKYYTITSNWIICCWKKYAWNNNNHLDG